MSDSNHPVNSEKSYPEFDDLKGSEIKLRLDMLKNILNNDFEEYSTNRASVVAEEQASIKNLQSGDDSNRSSNFSNIPDNFVVIAHRGWSGSYPENTLIGLREAIKIGCHSIEFDVSMTRDRRLIIIHDDTLSRTTNGMGIVSEWDYHDLRKLDAGSWFHPKYGRARLPSLEEVLLMSRSSGIGVNIEIKRECWEDSLLDDGVEQQIVRAIHRYGVANHVLISSFRWSFIERIHKIDSSISKALLHYKDLGKINVPELVTQYGIKAFNPNIMQLTQDFINRCHDKGIKVYPFTVNSYPDMEKVLNMRVDGFFTNHPNRVFRFLKEHDHHLQKLRQKEQKENVQDINEAIKRLELEEMDKARRRARWRTKRYILERTKQKEG